MSGPRAVFVELLARCAMDFDAAEQDARDLERVMRAAQLDAAETGLLAEVFTEELELIADLLCKWKTHLADTVAMTRETGRGKQL